MSQQPKFHSMEQGSDEWFAARLGKFGGTTAQALATNGKGLETKVFEKVAEILTGRFKYIPDNEDMKRGRELEDMARKIYELQTGREVETVGYVELDKYTGVSPDGFVGDDGLIEIKCPNDANFIRFMYDKKIDSGYLWQMQHQMFVTNRDWCDFVVFNDNLDRIEIIRVERDEEKIDKIKTGLKSGIEKIEKVLSEVSGKK